MYVHIVCSLSLMALLNVHVPGLLELFYNFAKLTKNHAGPHNDAINRISRNPAKSVEKIHVHDKI